MASQPVSLLVAEDHLFSAYATVSMLKQAFPTITIHLVTNGTDALKAALGNPFEAFGVVDDEERGLVFQSLGQKVNRVWAAFLLDCNMPYEGKPDPRAGIKVAEVIKKQDGNAVIFSHSGSALRASDLSNFTAEIPKGSVADVFKRLFRQHGVCADAQEGLGEADSHADDTRKEIGTVSPVDREPHAGD